MLSERRLTQGLFLDVEDRAQVLADTLALFDADRVFRQLGHTAIRPVDGHSQHVADRFATQLHVENLETVAVRDPFGGNTNRGQPFRRHA